MNPRARRLRRLRRERLRKAWRSKAKRARLQAYITRRVTESLRGLVGAPNFEASRQAIKQSCERFIAELSAPRSPITVEVTSTPEEVFRDGVISTRITMPVPPGFMLIPVTE